MAHFASEAELEAFLGELNPTYGQYATALWSNGITTQRQLANADKEDLLAAGVTSAIHAKDIKATAGTQGPAPDGSAALSQELLARLDTLPQDTQAVSHLFKQGRLPVPYGNLEALEDMTKELVVGSSGKLAEFFSNKIRNGGLLDATGRNEEVTGSLMLSLIIETWTILQQFLPPERFLPFDYNKNKQVSATVGSIHDPTAVADCQEVYNVQFEHHRAAFLLAVVHLQHLVQALLVRAPDRQMRAIQGVEDWQPTPTVNTCIIRHRNEVHKYLYLWNSFASLYGHRFEDVQVQECFIKRTCFRDCMAEHLIVLQQNIGPITMFAGCLCSCQPMFCHGEHS
ncbi:TPA: hypothetical protein ACH3X3_008930 [Trebouxia sp. C0006]